MKILIKNILYFFFISIISCQGQKKDYNQEILDSLPDEIANKTWIPYHIENTYDGLLKKIDFPTTRYVKTAKNSFSKLEGRMEPELIELKTKKIVKKNDKYIMYLNAPYLNYVSLSWVDKKKGLLDIKYVYKTPLAIDVIDSVFTSSYVDKNSITAKNFPIQKEEEIILEKEASKDLTKYEHIESLPVIGEFSCETTELRKSITFKSIKSELYDSESKVKEIQPFKVVVSLDEIRFVYVDLVCSLRKVKESSNRYVFLYNHTENAEDIPDNIIYHSENHPIGEMEVLEDKTIKFKWFGFYSRKTKKHEDYGDYGWIDNCNSVLKKIEE